LIEAIGAAATPNQKIRQNQRKLFFCEGKLVIPRNFAIDLGKQFFILKERSRETSNKVEENLVLLPIHGEGHPSRQR